MLNVGIEIEREIRRVEARAVARASRRVARHEAHAILRRQRKSEHARLIDLLRGMDLTVEVLQRMRDAR